MLNVVQLDASEASSTLRRSQETTHAASDKRIALIGAIAFAIVALSPALLNETLGAATFLILMVLTPLAVRSIYRSSGGEIIVEFVRFLSNTCKLLLGRTANVQWTTHGIGQFVTLPIYGRLADVLSSVAERQGLYPSPRRTPIGIGRRTAGLVLIFLGIACFLGLPLYLFVLLNTHTDKLVLGIAAVIGLLVLVMGGEKLLMLGRRIIQPSAKALILQDSRAPVVWLRAFRDDRTFLSSIHQVSFENDRSLEEILARELWHYGPVVAVGAPGEKLPRIGAARGYFDDTDWQQAIKHWMSLARLIVVVVGSTDWLRWEVETAMQDGHLSKVLFVFPPDIPSNRAARWSNTMTVLTNGKYPELLHADVTFARIGHFRGDDTFVLISDTAKDNIAYETASRIAIYGMLC